MTPEAKIVAKTTPENKMKRSRRSMQKPPSSSLLLTFKLPGDLENPPSNGPEL
jgi:hypothetical protein